jgi:hypothetical protein
LSERYGLSPTETASVLAAACAAPPVVAAVVLERCDGDDTATVDACRAVMGPEQLERALRGDPVVSPLTRSAPADADDEYAPLRAALGDPIGTDTTSISTDDGLVAALDAAASAHSDLGLERDGRE